MDIDIQELTERLTEVIAHRIEWCGDDEFDWPDAFQGVAYVGEGEGTSLFSEDGQFSIEIPMSLQGSSENDAVAYVNVTVEVSDVEEIC